MTQTLNTSLPIPFQLSITCSCTIRLPVSNASRIPYCVLGNFAPFCNSDTAHIVSGRHGTISAMLHAWPPKFEYMKLVYRKETEVNSSTESILEEADIRSTLRSCGRCGLIYLRWNFTRSNNHIYTYHLLIIFIKLESNIIVRRQCPNLGTWTCN